jgi:hypothetical protein
MQPFERFMGSATRFMGLLHFRVRNAKYVVAKPMKGVQVLAASAAVWLRTVTLWSLN